MTARRRRFYPAYHGEIEIDPATGEILRLSEVADPAPAQAMRAAKAVEYAPVKIGDQSYIRSGERYGVLDDSSCEPRADG